MPDNVTLDPPITNIERLLAKAAGMEGVSVDDPETRIERYLKAICDRLDNGGGSQLPEPTENDVGKVATVVDNSGTYEYGLETPQSGGGVLVVHQTDSNPASKVPTRGGGGDIPDDPDPLGTMYLDKTWQEIMDAFLVGSVKWVTYQGSTVVGAIDATMVANRGGTYMVVFNGDQDNMGFTTDSASGYPTLPM